MERITPVLLTVGTTHPLNIAGVGLDARLAARLGVRVVTVVAGVSAQNAHAVLARATIDDALIAAQFGALRDVPIGAIRIGALLSEGSVIAIARELRNFSKLPVICDPVIAASTGESLADDATVVALRDELFAHCTLVTPNLDEAGILVGRRLADVDAMARAGEELRAGGAGAVLVKGGHLAGDPVDVLVSQRGVAHFRAERLAGSLRGTGDILACSIAARLAHGDSLVDGIAFGRRFVRECIDNAVTFAHARTVA